MYEFHPIIKIILICLDVLHFIVLTYVVVDLLVQTKIINSQNQFVMRLHTALSSYIEPILEKIRKFIPVRGGLDFSPIVLFITISFIGYCIGYYGS